MNVSVVDRPAMRVAAVRHRGPYSQIGQSFARLGAIAGPAGLVGPGTTMIAVYHDDPESTAEQDLRSDAGLVIAESGTLPEGLTELRLLAGRYACTTHVGPYEGLSDAWARLMGEWLPRSGERVGDGVSYEIYRKTPVDTPRDELVTEMYVPLV